MSDKLNENLTPDDINETEVLDPPKPKLEENDGWKFDGVAHTLDDTVIENGELEIVIPKETASSYETRPRPTGPVPAQYGAAPAPREDNKNAYIFFAVAVIALIMAGVLTFFGIRYFTTPNTQEKMNPGNVAMSVNDTDISIGMYNYYYNSTVNYYLQQASYGSIELDSTKSYTAQKTTDDDGNEITWEERFKIDTVNQLKRLAVYYEAALDDGLELTEEQKKLIDEDIEQIKESATTETENEMDLDAYVSSNYGEYAGIATVRKLEEMSYLAQTYLRKATIEMVPDDERVQKYFEEHKDDYNQVEMSFLVMQYDETTKNDVIKQAKQYASQIHSREDLVKLIPVAEKDVIDSYVAAGTYGDADTVAELIASSSVMNVTKSNPNQLPQAIIDFLFDENNKVGACRTVANDEYKAVFIVLKTSDIELNKETVYTVRHILIEPKTAETDDDDTTVEVEATQEDWDKAKEEADKILTEYNGSERTEYDFALLAEKYSEDKGSTSEEGNSFGGLYQNTPLGQMVKNFENWATDENRNYGDVEIVKSRYGYHIMYFVDCTESYLAECKLQVQVEMEDEFVNAAKVKERNGMKKTTVAKPEASAATDGSNAYDDSYADVYDDSIVEEDDVVEETT